MRHSVVRLCPVDIGHNLYVQMHRPSIARYVIGAVSLYFQIVLRDFHGARIGPIVAAKVCWILYGDYGRAMRVWRQA